MSLFSRWRFAIVSFVLTFLAYGLLVGGLGYYWDDWMIPAVIKNGMSFWTFYAYNRPLSPWTFELLRFLGLNPLGWQIAALLFRWITGLTAWQAFAILWPNQRRAVEWMLYFFLISPAFISQVFAATYVQHFMIFPFYFISCALMMLAISRSAGLTNPAERKARIWQSKPALYALSYITELVHVFSMEYFWGLEFLRPYMIWKSLPDSLDKKQKAQKTFLIWLPYLVIFISAIIWRFGFAPIAEEDPNSLNLFSEFANAPLTTVVSFLVTFIRDMIYLFVSSWYPALQTGKIDVQPPGILMSWILVIATAFALWRFLRKEEITDSEEWTREAAWFGLYATLAGMLPTWAVGRQLTVGAFADRLTLSALLGVGIVVVAMTRLIVKERSAQVLFLSVLIGIAVGYHFRLANDYRWYWQRQARFFWQYSWRVPALEPNTGIVADGAQLPRVSDYAMSLALNTLYTPASLQDQQAYWFFELDRNFTYDLRALFVDMRIKDRLRNLYFEGRGRDVIVIAYQEGQCLWLLDETDSLNAALTPLTKRALPVSNPSRVISASSVVEAHDTTALTAIFGPEPAHDWCYFYEKANIAYQEKDWEKTIDFKSQADALGLDTKIGFELKPFVIAYANLDQWEQARALTVSAFERDVTSKQLYCDLWRKLVDEFPRSDPRDDAFLNVDETLKCKAP